MKLEDKLEEVQFWLRYINDWETNHNEPIPDRVLLLLDNALLKLKGYCPEKRHVLNLQGNNPMIH